MAAEQPQLLRGADRSQSRSDRVDVDGGRFVALEPE
jgi:hypothetical protein